MPTPTSEIVARDEEPETAIVKPMSDSVSLFERLARDPSVDVEKLERLIGMQERILAHQARAAFNAAFSELQGEIPAIVERGKTNNGTYARLEDIIERVRPILQRHGFALSHRTEWPDAKTVKVIGVLTHKGGHERTSEFLSTGDTSGNKNAIQALGSAVSYGRRYTAKDLLNIVTTDEDDDGEGTGAAGAPAPPEGFEDWADDMAAVAEEGMRRLSEASRKSDPKLTAYTLKYRRDLSDQWKAKAQKADRGRDAA